MMRKLIFIFGLFCCTAAHAAETCDTGYYLDGDTCIQCPAGTYKDTTGPQECTLCPPADETTVRTTIPDSYYPYDSVTGTYAKTTEPIFLYNYIPSWMPKGAKAITNCFVMGYYKNAATTDQLAVEGISYNPSTGKYDANDGDVRYNAVNPGYYLDTRFRDGYCNQIPNTSQPYSKAIICPAGYYCPGGGTPRCTSGPYETEWGRIECPAAHYCAAGASAPTPCPVGTYSDTTGASVCKACTNAPDNTHYTGSGNANDCPWECDAGYGLHNGACLSLCAAGMQHLKTGNGLHFNLYQVAYSTPALHVKHNDTVCYGVLAPGAATNAININHNGQVYHTVD